MITKIFILLGGIFVFAIIHLICIAASDVDDDSNENYWEEYELDDGVDH